MRSPFDVNPPNCALPPEPVPEPGTLPVPGATPVLTEGDEREAFKTMAPTTTPTNPRTTRSTATTTDHIGRRMPNHTSFWFWSVSGFIPQLRRIPCRGLIRG